MAPTSKNVTYEHVQTFFVENPIIEFVRWQWVDITGLVRARLTTVRQTLRLASQEQSISVASPMFNAFILDGSFNEVNAGAKDCLVPDWSTLLPCYYAPKHAAIMCFIDEPGQDFSTCPRTLLKRQQESIEKSHNINFWVGVEIEFYLTPSIESGVPVEEVNAYCSTSSLKGSYLTVLEDSVRCIEDARIPVWTFHSELVAGLFELQIEPMTPLAASDAVVYIHETIKATAQKHGLHATMHPKPFDDTHGVGEHFHISLPPETKNEDSFLAGVLASIPGLSAITMPNYDSYLRRDFMGADWVSWDLENRLATVRKIKSAYWEFRFVDATANTYLALACILGTGMAGWVRGDVLTIKPLGGLAGGSLDDKIRRELRIDIALPKNLGEAVEALKVDNNVLKVLGEEMGQRFLRYKAKEEATLGALTLEERRSMCMALF